MVGDGGVGHAHALRWAGRRNATSTLIVVEVPADTSVLVASAPVTVRRLWGEFALSARFPWFEYLPRMGWLPDGKR